MEILVDLAMKDCAARGVNLPASLKQAGRSWPIWAVRIQSQCAAGREAREEALISNIITFSPTGYTHTRTDANTDTQTSKVTAAFSSVQHELHPNR